MNLETIPLANADGDYVAVVEATRGTRNKLKYDAPLESFLLTGVLPIGFAFPYDFGFLPSTEGGDGDPLDVLVLADEPIPPGTLVPCRVVGVIAAEQQDAGSDRAERNDRLIAVASHSHRYREIHALADLADNVLDEIEGFFVFYNQQKGGRFTPLSRGGADCAKRLIDEGVERAGRRAA